MNVQVLELTPSTSGWYFATAYAAWRGRLLAPRVTMPRLPEESVQTSPALLGYGADGRPRPVPPRSRICFLA